MPHLSMFVMLYLEKKIPQPPPESFYINRIGIKWLFRPEKRYAPPQNIFHTTSSKTRYLSPGAREQCPVRTERTNISKILAGGMPLLVRKPKIYLYNTSLRHLEHSMERIGSDTRAYHSLASSFVWDVPNVTVTDTVSPSLHISAVNLFLMSYIITLKTFASVERCD